jgi:hypothetical protein
MNYDLSTTGFDTLVRHFFQPLSARVGAPLKLLREGIYEIGGSAFVLRIRRGTGHSRDFLVTLSRRASGKSLDDLSDEIGLGVIAQYNQRSLRPHDLDSELDWKLALEEAAEAATAFCLPYLSNAQSDLSGVELFIRTKVEASGIKNKGFQFPSNVQKKWK